MASGFVDNGAGGDGGQGGPQRGGWGAGDWSTALLGLGMGLGSFGKRQGGNSQMMMLPFLLSMMQDEKKKKKDALTVDSTTDPRMYGNNPMSSLPAMSMFPNYAHPVATSQPSSI